MDEEVKKDELQSETQANAQQDPPKKLKKSHDIGGVIARILIYTFCIGHMASLLIPFIWGFITTLKSPVDFRYNMFGLPKEWKFENYLTVLKNFTVEYKTVEYRQTFTYVDMLWNSITYACIAAFTGTMAQYFVAYAAAKFNFKFSKVLDAIVLFTMTIPIYGTAASELQMSYRLGVIGNFWMVAVVTQLSFLGMSYFIIQACLRGIPTAFAESAEIDGANNFTVLFRIYIPLTMNIIATLFFMDVIGFWNSYGVNLVQLPNRPVAAYGLWKFRETNVAEVAHVTIKLAGCFIQVLPVFVVFMIFHEKFMGSISLAEGIKE